MTWASEKIFTSGDDFYQNLLSQIHEAQQEILFEFYIFSPDAIGELFEKALMEAQQRGVHVRVLVDGVGSQEWIQKRMSILKNAQIKVRIYHPLISQTFSNTMRPFLKSLLQFNHLLSRLNRRDHRKVVVIDRSVAFVGSYNLHICHSETYSHPPWQDCAVQITGKNIPDIAESFYFVWNRSSFLTLQNFLPHKRNSDSTRNLFVQILDGKHFNANFNFLSHYYSAKQFIRKIHSARERIWIMNPYIAPPVALLNALQKAALRGIDVRLYLSTKSDVFFMPWVAQAHYRNFLKSGVKIFENQHQFIHAKCVIIDNFYSLGSSNLNRRSYFHDFEFDVVLTQQHSFTEILNLFHKMERESLPVLKSQSNLRSLLGRLILFLFGRFL